MSMEKGLFIFHRDLRIIDNIGLINAGHTCKELYLCFIFTPDQVGKNNSYRSQNAIQFMIESLDELSKDIPVIIHCRSGARSAAVVNALEQQYGFTNLYNLKGGITAYSNEIDANIKVG
jgi:rhodanese-related sulfurtransferase